VGGTHPTFFRQGEVREPHLVVVNRKNQKQKTALNTDSAFQGFYLKIIGVQTLRRKT
jgi:hypothetical protein